MAAPTSLLTYIHKNIIYVFFEMILRDHLLSYISGFQILSQFY